MLHAGGKFDNDSYKVAGGLHGVGASVVNALSKSLKAEVRRDGWTYSQSFRRGKPLGDVERGEPARGTGTTVRFRPDEEVFGSKLQFDAELIAERLEAKSYLHGGLSFVLTDETKTPPAVQRFVHPQGIAESMPVLAGDAGKLRSEGKDYVVKDGDVMLFRFNVQRNLPLALAAQAPR